MRVLALVVLLALAPGCRTAVEPPPTDTSGPGWRTLQGQAVWKPGSGKPELAGDLVLASNDQGDFVIAFTKTPFPMASAQSINGRWRVQFGSDRYLWHGRGAPPRVFSWFELPRALAGTNLDPGWRFHGNQENWSLENPRTGERLEGYFSK